MLSTVDYEPVQLLCPVTYQFVDFNPELKELIGKIINKEVESVRLAPAEMEKLADMNIPPS